MFLGEELDKVIHAIVDGLENPLHFMFSKGEIFDCDIAIDLLSNIEHFK